MSPEQLLSAKTVDARADLWALGVVLYELLAGSAPFRADTMPELCAMVLGAPLPRVRAVRPDVPPEVEAVILHCMERQPAQRFQTVVEVMSALAPFGAHDATQRVSRAAALLGVPPVSAARSASSAAGHRPSTPLPAPTMPFPLSPSAVKPAAPPPPTELFTPVPASGAPHTPAPLVPPTISGTAVTGPVAAPKRGLGLVLALVGAGVVLGPLLGWAVVRATSAPSAGAPATATPPSSAGESAPTAPSAAPAPVTPSAVAALSASASAAPSAAAPPTVTPASVPVARPTPPSRAAAAPAPAPAPSPRPAAAPPRPKDTIGF
jgi:serine/threonine-protein kinase